ncbi:hypothetical protein XENORESO_008591 [Xenotaenia resolanae]|uniref:Uncharacterized protein n=1 Tax=Xenotaenia resolanae TaxID=208358 RepID=A0ABV0VXA2_9TELE
MLLDKCFMVSEAKMELFHHNNKMHSCLCIYFEKDFPTVKHGGGNIMLRGLFHCQLFWFIEQSGFNNEQGGLPPNSLTSPQNNSYTMDIWTQAGCLNIIQIQTLHFWNGLKLIRIDNL